ncbi:hypothetical protein XA68_13571 [Ophiocordyceps unilateralis]|uniref:CFEM domain-containing protein n=1 Tax=Ophiocordyceps unilateralis TaxID=268505 RepID=A0A2A9PB53_OPHUN|nr:hypothetical protein XA68_13571 [Ophiocordyceps unilateralis]
MAAPTAVWGTIRGASKFYSVHCLRNCLYDAVLAYTNCRLDDDSCQCLPHHSGKIQGNSRVCMLERCGGPTYPDEFFSILDQGCSSVLKGLTPTALGWGLALQSLDNYRGIPASTTSTQPVLLPNQMLAAAATIETTSRPSEMPATAATIETTSTSWPSQIPAAADTVEATSGPSEMPAATATIEPTSLPSRIPGASSEPPSLSPSKMEAITIAGIVLCTTGALILAIIICFYRAQLASLAGFHKLGKGRRRSSATVINEKRVPSGSSPERQLDISPYPHPVQGAVAELPGSFSFAQELHSPRVNVELPSPTIFPPDEKMPFDEEPEHPENMEESCPPYSPTHN